MGIYQQVYNIETFLRWCLSPLQPLLPLIYYLILAGVFLVVVDTFLAPTEKAPVVSVVNEAGESQEVDVSFLQTLGPVKSVGQEKGLVGEQRGENVSKKDR